MDPGAAKTQSLKMVELATRRLAEAHAEHRACIAFASESGNSLRDIAAAAAVSHQTVKNMLTSPE